MIGAELYYDMDKSEIKYSSGDKEENESKTSSLALSVGYNFNEDLSNSWWIKASIGGGTIETETKDTRSTPQKEEAEIDVEFFTVEAGKRFSLKSWGLQNFSYSPSIAFMGAAYGDDADDAGLERSGSVQFNILKFDILF